MLAHAAQHDGRVPLLPLAGHVSLTNFDIKMLDGAMGPCIQFNEGQGGGTSSGYFNYWVTARGIKVGSCCALVLLQIELAAAASGGGRLLIEQCLVVRSPTAQLRPPPCRAWLRTAWCRTCG